MEVPHPAARSKPLIHEFASVFVAVLALLYMLPTIDSARNLSPWVWWLSSWFRSLVVKDTKDGNQRFNCGALVVLLWILLANCHVQSRGYSPLSVELMVLLPSKT